MLSLTDPLCIELSKMTATVIIYTNQGFAIAADGLELWEDPDTHQRSLRPGGDRIQKIFVAERKDATLAYILRGQIATEDRTFDLEAEVRNQLALLTTSKFNRVCLPRQQGTRRGWFEGSRWMSFCVPAVRGV
jgi:hypothetical protein